ncbi:phage tail-collar fiber domain-containing protein [Pseudomonas entomophila]|uniref:phage tail-collar fiber domain-containing protein n=1 Tax=Pseudomonas entomophila TaxID=312306 RepID=UPI003EBEBFD9
MSQTYFALLTAIGEAKLANALSLGTQLEISQMAVGDGNGDLPTPTRDQTRLINERYRASLNNLAPDPLNPSQIIAELVIPETEGGYWLREMGLFDAAGDLVAVSNCPPSYKPQMAEGSGRTQVLRMVLIVSSTEAVQLKIDPSVVLATRQYVDQVAQAHLDHPDPHAQYRLRGRFTHFTAHATLTASHEGVVVVDAAKGARTLTLPPANAALGVRDFLIRRLDNTGNRVKVQTAGSDRIKFHTHLRSEGYPFLVLMGAGDWWHLRSDGAGNWWPVGRFDGTPVGHISFAAGVSFAPGGYGVPNGGTLSRAEWPWVWDHAQASGMLVGEAARRGNEGSWATGNGTSTFRLPDARGEFIRLLDENRGVDAGRQAGSWQDGTWIRTVVQEWSGSDMDHGAYIMGTAYAQPDGRISTVGTGGAVPPGAKVAGGNPYPLETTDNSCIGEATLETAQAINNWIRLRSRNMAYPGRIKLI